MAEGALFLVVGLAVGAAAVYALRSCPECKKCEECEKCSCPSSTTTTTTTPTSCPACPTYDDARSTVALAARIQAIAEWIKGYMWPLLDLTGRRPTNRTCGLVANEECAFENRTWEYNTPENITADKAFLESMRTKGLVFTLSSCKSSGWQRCRSVSRATNQYYNDAALPRWETSATGASSLVAQSPLRIPAMATGTTDKWEYLKPHATRAAGEMVGRTGIESLIDSVERATTTSDILNVR